MYLLDEKVIDTARGLVYIVGRSVEDGRWYCVRRGQPERRRFYCGGLDDVFAVRDTAEEAEEVVRRRIERVREEMCRVW